MFNVFAIVYSDTGKGKEQVLDDERVYLPV
jgi:hypothetical protein